MRRKNTNRRIQNHRGRQERYAANELPPRRWWHKILETNKVIAAGGVGLVVVTVAGIYIVDKTSNEQFRRSHRPNITFIRPIQMTKPLNCDPMGQGNASLHVWVKNIGNTNAVHVIPLPLFSLLRIGEKIERVTNIATDMCSGGGQKDERANTGHGFTLPPNREIDIELPMGIGGFPPPGESPVQALVVACVDYSDEHGYWRVECDIQRFRTRFGQRDFVCGRDTPIDGGFDIYPFGSCTSD